MTLRRIAADLARAVDALRFAAPVTHVYNPLDYARRSHGRYLDTWGAPPRDVLLVGMNPGPFGMAQTGVPFGEVELVRDWLGIAERVDHPVREHPRRPVEGFACRRSEVSGRRLWGWARERFGTPESFFQRFFVWNYCPLLFLERSGRNRTPDKLSAGEQAPLLEACDRALARVIDAFGPRVVVGIGRFAEARVRAVVADRAGVTVGGILHPSPASPRANRGWAQEAERQLRSLGVDVPVIAAAVGTSTTHRRER